MSRGYNYQADVNFAVAIMKLLFQIVVLVGKGLLWLFRKFRADKKRSEIAQTEAQPNAIDLDKQAKFERLMAKLDADLMEEGQAPRLLEARSAE